MGKDLGNPVGTSQAVRENTVGRTEYSVKLPRLMRCVLLSPTALWFVRQTPFELRHIFFSCLSGGSRGRPINYITNHLCLIVSQ